MALRLLASLIAVLSTVLGAPAAASAPPGVAAVTGNQIPVPRAPMGWSSWNSFGEFAPRPANIAPYVLAKQDLTFRRPAKARLVGVIKDDALPSNTRTSSWSQVDGPGTAIFADPAAATTVATFAALGTYTLRLTATDGAATSSSTVAVTATPIPDVINVSTDGVASASYTSPWESVAAVNDGIDPPTSNDGVNRRWGTWPNEGEQWVQRDWTAPVRVNASDLYFFDDNGGVRVPASWRIQYWDDDSTVDLNLQQLGATAVKHLVAVLDGGQRSGVIRQPCRLVVRESTGQLPASGELDVVEFGESGAAGEEG